MKKNSGFNLQARFVQIFLCLLFVPLGAGLILRADHAGATGEIMGQYTNIPPFLTIDVKPNIVLALDISGSMKACAYRDTSIVGSWKSPNVHHDYNPDTSYYGYFESTNKYSYDSTNRFFKEDASGDWDGNFMNWLCMRRIDVARKVMVGGWVRDRNGESIDGNTWYVLKGNHEPYDYTFTKRYADSATEGLTPAEYLDGTEFLISEGQIFGAAVAKISDTPDGIEMGIVTMNWKDGMSWTEVQFQNTYTNPVVVAKSVSYNGGEPCSTRVKDVGDAGIGANGGFRIRLHEWKYLDGDHTNEDIMYIVVEAGHHIVPLDGDGTIEFDARIVEGVTACGTDNFLTVNYNTAFSAPPILFTGLSTYNGPDMTITRNKDVTDTDFKVVLQESENHGSTNCSHGNAEEIHCIAVSTGAGTIAGAGTLIEAGTLWQADNNGWRKIQYTTAFPEDAIVVTDMQTTQEADPAILRFKKAIDDSVMVRVREEKSSDNETNHAKETVAYLAVTGGGAFNIQVGVQTEPTGIIQGLSSKARFGLAVYNYDHSRNPTKIYYGNTVNGGTFNPCYPDTRKDVDDRTNYDICRETHTKAPIADIVKVIETHPLIWGTTPIAETLYEIYGYFAQIDHTPARSNVQFYNNGTDGNKHCFGADNQYTQADCEAAGGTWQNADSYRISNDFDPYYYYEAGAVAPCAMSFVLHFNDGAPYKDWDDDNTNPDIFGGGTTDYDGDGNGGPKEILDDLALYLRDNDIRSDDSPNTHQEIISYYVYAALGEGELNNDSTKKMREAAVNGGFEDRDDDHAPDPAHPADFIAYINNKVCTENEWDSDADCNPDTFYNADNGYELVTELTAALMDILRRTASGTAASVISNSRAGEGAIYQAVFYPNQLDDMGNEVDWIGDVHSIWIDKYGNIREDCGGADGADVSCGDPCDASCACDPSCPKDNILDMKKDYIIEFYSDEQGAAKAKRFEDTNGNGKYLDPADYDESTDPLCAGADSGSDEEAYCTAAQGGDNLDLVETNIPIREIRYIWDAGNWLAAAGHTQKASYSDTTDERHIFTWFTGANDDPVAFTTTALAAAAGPNYFRFFNAADATEADKIINFIRGQDQSGCRSRRIDWDGDGTVETYKLGDIVHSTPTIVSRPAEDYDMIYADPTYQIFRKKYENRRIMIYAGGNDGGLHAFNGGYFDRFGKEFLKGPAGKTQYDLGAEMWMFIPYNLLPHLKWLTDPAYGGNNHVYYVDLKPRIFDAKIFDPDDGIHSGGWGTVLVGGMRFGGGEIGVDLDGNSTDETTMRSSYFVLDITNPECPPVILAEFTDANLGFTTCYPTAIPMVTCDLIGQTDSTDDDCDPDNPSMDWYIAFGSGPHPADQAAMQGTSDQLAGLYILKLGDTTTPVYETTPQPTPAGACPTLYTYNRPAGPVAGYPVSIDAALANSFFSDIITVDFDLSYQAEALYLGSIYNTNAATLDGHKGAMHRLTIDDNYSTPAAWSLDTFINVERPVTAAPSVAYDGTDYWVYFGTGRFIISDDKMTTAQESYYGIKEPVDVNGNLVWPTYAAPLNLMDVTGVNVKNATGELSGSVGDASTFSVGDASTFGELRSSEIDLHDGWKFDFSLCGERNLGQAALLGDIVAFSSYVPSNDYCTAEGVSYLYAVYYLTGTSYYKSVIGVEEETGYIFKKRSMGRGLATTPNIHTGVTDTVKSFVQTSTGAVVKIEQDNPGVIKSGPASWRELR
ncbi:MAG: PilC/PilY family type IV pilus protein [Thermodesulfobacteriota bacterium]|nr:PilC/PilY family type IV pilus protein [Thermodesulfobacteriota bacterium]